MLFHALTFFLPNVFAFLTFRGHLENFYNDQNNKFIDIFPSKFYQLFKLPAKLFIEFDYTKGVP